MSDESEITLNGLPFLLRGSELEPIPLKVNYCELGYYPLDLIEQFVSRQSHLEASVLSQSQVSLLDYNGKADLLYCFTDEQHTLALAFVHHPDDFQGDLYDLVYCSPQILPLWEQEMNQEQEI